MVGKLNIDKIADDISFYSVIDERFKTNRLSINFTVELNIDTVTLNALIPQILGKGFSGCDNFRDFNRKLEELYGAYVETYIQKKGDYQVLTLSITGIDDKFSLEGESVSKKCAEILCKMVLTPILENGVFKEQYVELEKKVLIDSIEAEINEKRIYALNKAMRFMCENEPYGLPKYGFKDRVLEITPKTVKKQYDDILANSKIDIMFVGCGDYKNSLEIFSKEFKSLGRNAGEIKIKRHQTPESVKEKTEKIDVNQSKLVMGFSAKAHLKDALVMPTRVMTAILGGTTSSKLFINVREKLSLCYYCAARYDMLKGILTIDSGVENKNLESAKKEILAQLDLIKSGDFTEEEINFAKLSLKNSYSSIYENDSSIEGFYLNKIIQNNITTPQKEVEELNKVTREEIIEAAKGIILDTVYVLTENSADTKDISEGE